MYMPFFRGLEERIFNCRREVFYRSFLCSSSIHRGNLSLSLPKSFRMCACFRKTIFCDPHSPNAKEILTELGFPIAADPAGADLFWMRRVGEAFHQSLRECQLLNHLPNERALVNKGDLAHYLKIFDRTRPIGDLALSEFYPETYRLYVEEECRAFFAQLPEQDARENAWIFKPTDSSRGRGVQITWQFEGLKQMYRDLDSETFAWAIGGGEEYVVQRYLANPLLLHGRKSEIRVYWLIACPNPLLVLLFKEGTTRLNSRPYRLDDFDDELVHVTNVYQQKHHPEYNPALVLKWSFSRLESYLAEERKSVGPSFIDRRLRPQLNERLGFALGATAERLAQVPARGHFFGLYGADFILDDRLRPWLTEVQLTPGLGGDDPVKRRVVVPMLDEAVQIVREVQERKRRGGSLKRLDSVEGFEWVENRA